MTFCRGRRMQLLVNWMPVYLKTGVPVLGGASLRPWSGKANCIAYLAKALSCEG